MPNIYGGQLNFIFYSGSPGRLTGALQAGEVSLASVITTARVSAIYESKAGGGFNSFNPNSPNFSSLKVLQPGKTYAIQAKIDFDLQDVFPHPDPTFQTALRNYVATQASPSPSPLPGPGPSPSPTPSVARNLGMNITNPSDYHGQIEFKNVMTRARDWISNKTGQPFGQGGPLNLDANGWVQSLQTDQTALTPIFLAGVREGVQIYPTGEYTITWEGQGTISNPTSNVTVVSNAANRRVINYNGDDLWIQIDSVNSSNPIRNIKIFKSEYESTLSTDPFYPTFISRLQGFTTIRFMDFFMINSSNNETWATRTTLNSHTQASNRGAAIEWAIALCNKIGANPYFCLPAKANDDYVTQFARLVRDTLAPNLTIYIEYSNEIWNGIFSQGAYCLERANALGIPGGSDFEKIVRFQGRRSTQILNIWKTEFGANASRVKHVMGTQISNVGVSDLILAWNDPLVGQIKESVDFMAGAPYFDGLDPSLINPSQLASETEDQLFARMDTSIALHRSYWQDQKARYTNSKGVIPLICYEGGQHNNPAAFPQANQTAIYNRMLALQRSPKMKARYKTYLNHWFTDVGNNALFCHFNFTYAPTTFGFWGSLEYQDQPVANAPKYQACTEVLTGV